MPQCLNCGERLRRVHRTFWERLLYMGIFECRKCQMLKTVPRRYTYYLSEQTRCPRCGTYQVRRLSSPDRIDPMHRHPLSMLQHLFGGKLFHCRYCRIQFYDRRAAAAADGAK